MVLFFIHLTLSPGLRKGPPGCNMQPTNMAAHFAANITTGTRFSPFEFHSAVTKITTRHPAQQSRRQPTPTKAVASRRTQKPSPSDAHKSRRLTTHTKPSPADAR